LKGNNKRINKENILNKEKSKNRIFNLFVKLFSWIAKGTDKEVKKNNFCKT